MLAVARRMNASQIAADLAERIREGELHYRPGDQLPSYRELGDLYTVSASTIAKVILILKLQGLVEGEPGVGVFVR